MDISEAAGVLFVCLISLWLGFLKTNSANILFHVLV